MTVAIPIAAALVQALLMSADEGYFHRARGLPRWERIGHPLDTATVIACYAWLCLTVPSKTALTGYAALAIASSVFITKDEPIHRRLCKPAECWLHAMLFVVHPVVLACMGWAWLAGETWLVRLQLVVTAVVLVHQIVYWNVLPRRVQA